MFVLKKTASYLWPVKTEIPKSGGSYEKEKFEIEFKRLPDSENKKTFGLTAEGESKKTDKNFCKEVVLGWKEVKDESGEDVPFSTSALDELLEIPGVSGAIVSAYLDSIAGAKIKN